jgi:hypothetical protein
MPRRRKSFVRSAAILSRAARSSSVDDCDGAAPLTTWTASSRTWLGAIRMHARRLTRLTNAFSKKVENHAHAVALHCITISFASIRRCG